MDDGGGLISTTMRRISELSEVIGRLRGHLKSVHHALDFAYEEKDVAIKDKFIKEGLRMLNEALRETDQP